MSKLPPANDSLLLTTAMSYIEAGMRVHPVRPPRFGDDTTGKDPRIEKWSSRTLTLAEFQSEIRAGDNLGVAAGKVSGFVCVDIDPHNGGSAWYFENEHRFGHCIRETTGSGGTHLYYRWPAGVESIPNRRGREGIAKGVEICSDGSQVVTWPSRHWSGGVYRFEYGLTLLDLEAEADELPQWLIEAAGKKAEPKVLPEQVAGKVQFDLQSNVEWAKDFLSKIDPPVAKHGRNNHTFYAACRLRDHAISEGQALTLMQEVFLPRTQNGAPYSPARIQEVVHKAYKYSKNTPGCDSPQADFESVDVTSTDPELTPEAQEVQEAAVIGPDKVALKAFKKLLAEPLRCAEELLKTLDGRIQIAGEVVYSYSEQTHVWAVLSDTQFRAMVASMLLSRDPAANTVLDPAKVKKVADSIRLILEHRRFEARPNTWLDGRCGNFVRLKNGILDISTATLAEHSKDWFSFTRLPYGYDPAAQCPEFEKFLQSIWPDDAEAADALRLWLGYVLLSEVLEQKFALLIGASRGGKGVLLRLMEKMIGRESTAACTITSLANEHGLAHLIGKSLAVFGDVVRAPGAAGEVATERLISIIGQDPQVINPKNGALFTAYLPLKIVMACNELPYFINARQALSNRMLVFPFKESFAGREDAGLEKRLEAELPGILNWAIVGAQRLISGAEKLRMPKRADSVFLDIKKRLDSVFGFLTERGEVTKYVGWEDEYTERATETRAAYEAYQAWCKDNGHMPKSMANFADALVAYGGGNIERKRVRRGGRQPIVFVNFTLLPSELSEFN